MVENVFRFCHHSLFTFVVLTFKFANLDGDFSFVLLFCASFSKTILLLLLSPLMLWHQCYNWILKLFCGARFLPLKIYFCFYHHSFMSLSNIDDRFPELPDVLGPWEAESMLNYIEQITNFSNWFVSTLSLNWNLKVFSCCCKLFNLLHRIDYISVMFTIRYRIWRLWLTSEWRDVFSPLILMSWCKCKSSEDQQTRMSMTWCIHCEIGLNWYRSSGRLSHQTRE